MSLTPKELSVLLGSAGVGQSLKQSEAWLQAADVADWAPVLEAALDHGTLALVCWHLQSIPDEEVAPEIKAAAQSFLNQQRATFEDGIAQWRKVLNALEREGVEPIPYKGPVSAASYGNHPWLRSFRDLDVLVHQSKFDKAIACLEGMGYSDHASIASWQRRAIRNRARQVTLFSSGLAVEPHFGFAQRSLGLELRADDVIRRCAAGTVLGCDVRVMAREDTILMLALHGCKERWNRLIWIVDIAEYLKINPDLNWELVFSTARANGLERCMLLALLLSHDLLGARVPDELVRLARGNSVCIELALQINAALTSRKILASWSEVKSFHSRLLERPRDRLRAIFEAIFGDSRGRLCGAIATSAAWCGFRSC